MICPICKKDMTDKNEIEFIENEGECASCEHISSDSEPVDTYGQDYPENQFDNE